MKKVKLTKEMLEDLEAAKNQWSQDLDNGVEITIVMDTSKAKKIVTMLARAVCPWWNPWCK